MLNQTQAINKLMMKRKWLTIPQIRSELKSLKLYAMETTISARIRDLRKAGRTVNRRMRADSSLYEYRVV